MNRRLRKKIWICGDVLMDIFPSFDHAQLGLKMALLSDRFDCLVDAHFDGKSELTIWNDIRIFKDKGRNANNNGPKAKLFVGIKDKSVDFPLPDHPLPTKICFKNLWISWICSEVWMDILPSFDRPQLGLKMALLSDRFDVLVDAHFDGRSELTIWREIRIRKDKGPKPKLSVWIGGKFVDFPMPDHSLPIKIRFKKLRINYIDRSVIEFLSSNKQIWDRMGTNLELSIEHCNQSIWHILDRQIWPIFATNIRHLSFPSGAYLDNLRRHTSPTILTDLDQLTSIDSGVLFPDGIADDGPNATVGQALAKWLHTPSKNAQPKQLHRNGYLGPPNLEWVDNFKEAFRRATTSVSYKIQLYFRMEPTPNEQFELVNERTKEKLTLKQNFDEFYANVYNWLLQRCPIGETATAPIKFDLRYGNILDVNLNKIHFELRPGNICIGPLSPPAEEEKEEKADKSNENIV